MLNERRVGEIVVVTRWFGAVYTWVVTGSWVQTHAACAFIRIEPARRSEL
jgi:hypothetical protein